MKIIYSLIMLFAFLTACEVPARGEGTAVPVATSLVSIPSSTVPIAPPPETILAPTLVPNPTATADTRLPPESWQEWPIVPAVTKRALEIYRTGQMMGLDTHAFSKVGDCQSVKAAFMGYFDIPERYSLGNDYAFLQQTIDNFAGYFNTDGQAVKGGFNAAAVLSPIWADPNVCLAGEDPLECELRVTKPIIVIVSLEVWWDGRTPQQYETLMRRILDTIIAHGSVPILATKADNVEGDNSLNLTTANLAYEYDLPLWNFWAAVQSLPAHGMDTKRNDGFHISTDAWSTRSFTGLEALDSIWRGLLKAVPAVAATRTMNMNATPGAIATSVQYLAPTAILQAGATPLGSSDRIIFGLAQRQGEGYKYSGVYLLDLNTRQTRQIFGSGVRFQSASPDGKYLLVSEGSALYRTSVDGAAPLRLTDSLYAFGNTDAVWLPNQQIAAVLTKSKATIISILSADGAVVSELPASGASSVEIYPTSNDSQIYWESGSCSSPGVCQRGGAWVTSLDGEMNKVLTGITGPALAPDGGLLVSGVSSTTNQNNLVFTAPDGSNPRSYPLPGNLLVDYAWSPAGEALAAVVAIRSDYSGKILGNRNFLIDPHTLAVSEYSQSNLLNPRVLWSPDGSFLFWVGTTPSESGYKIGGNLVNRTSKQVADLGNAIDISSPDYLAVINADWLPHP
jgi:Tol biopolymer transport system component